MLHFSKTLNFAIIGGGPAGFFCAKKLLKNYENSTIKNLRVDIFDRLPVPFGLIRYGVAPDAPDLKKAQNELSTGNHLKINEIAPFYSGIIFAYGASEEHRLNIKGENLKGVCSGKDIAQWYNGHFDYSNFDIDFSRIKNVSIIGNGNVALDVARILSRKLEELAATDISEKAFKLIKDNKIENIFINARRGPLESAFTLKELRDFSKLEYIDFFALKPEMESLSLQNLKRPEKRKMEFMQKTFKILENVEEINKMISFKPSKKRIIFRYLISPIEICGDKFVSSAIYHPNALTMKDGLLTAVKKTNASTEQIFCDLFVKSVGFKSIKVDESLPFDIRKNIIPNDQGIILGSVDTLGKGKYVAGWIKTGPKGTIANTFSDCEETLNSIFDHINNQELELRENQILEILRIKNLKFYTFQDWCMIDEYEKNIGQQNGKPREKIVEKETLDSILSSLKKNSNK